LVGCGESVFIASPVIVHVMDARGTGMAFDSFELHKRYMVAKKLLDSSTRLDDNETRGPSVTTSFATVFVKRFAPGVP